MKIKSFEFNLRELAGAMGDFGTLFPLAIGYIAICGVNPAGLLVMMGVANIITGLVYRLPMPIEPMKVIAVVAIAQHWQPSMVCAAGIAMGLAWLVFSATGIIGWIARNTPLPVIRGIQVALGLLLSIEACRMIATGWMLGIVSIALVIILRDSRFAPAAVVLVLLGIILMALRGHLSAGVDSPASNFPIIISFDLHQVWEAFILAGCAQIPLTATNAVIATSSLITTYWPQQPVSPQKLAINTGLMNSILPVFGGMPLCHGAGGLAGQYYFGARTGGANIIEGAIEIFLGLFFASSLAYLFSVFPRAILGAMMLLVGIELIKFIREIPLKKDAYTLGATILISLVSNMAFGFAAGIAVHYIVHCLRQNR